MSYIYSCVNFNAFYKQNGSFLFPKIKTLRSESERISIQNTKKLFKIEFIINTV